jgi:hypothetical protein
VSAWARRRSRRLPPHTHSANRLNMSFARLEPRPQERVAVPKYIPLGSGFLGFFRDSSGFFPDSKPSVFARDETKSGCPILRMVSSSVGWGAKKLRPELFGSPPYAQRTRVGWGIHRF